MANNGGSSGQFPAKLPLFDGTNYDRWIVQMKVVFRYQKVLEVIRNGVVATAGEQLASQQEKDAKALFLIHQCVDSEVFEKIAEYETAKGAWDALQHAYSGDARLKKVKLQTLRRQYENLKMEEKDSISEYLGKLTLVTNQMRNNGEKISEQLKVEKVLRTLTPEFDYVVTAVEQSKDLDTLKLEELQGTLEANEIRIKGRKTDKEKEKATEEVLMAKFRKNNSNWKNKGKGNWKGKNPRVDNSDDSDVTESGKKLKKKINKKHIQCYNCQRWGHFADECVNERVPRKNKDGEAQYADCDESDEEEEVLMAITDDDAREVEYWYLDTGCSNHMTGNKTWFCELDESVKRNIRFADGRSIKAEGIGKVEIRRSNDKKTVIGEVLYVPGMKSNLISMGQLLERGIQ